MSNNYVTVRLFPNRHGEYNYINISRSDWTRTLLY